MLRTAAKVIAYALGIVALVVAILIGALLYMAAPTRDQVVKAVSPNGRVAATLIETNGGATTSFGYVVQLAPSEDPEGVQSVATLYAAQRSAQAYGVNLRWQSDSELAVEFLSASSAELLNANLVVGGEAVRIVLRPGITDELAPAGGMLYNLKNQARKQ